MSTVGRRAIAARPSARLGRRLGDADQGRPQQPVGDAHSPALHHLGNGARRQLGRRQLEHRLMQLVVELLAPAPASTLRTWCFSERRQQRALGHLDARRRGCLHGLALLARLGGTLPAPGARLSATSSRSRAKPVTANLRASSTSRWVRWRRFSISASVRSSRSLSSATPRPRRRLRLQRLRRLGRRGRGRLVCRSSFIISSRIRRAQQPADHPRGVVDQRNDAGIVHARRADHADGTHHGGLAPVAPPAR